MADLERRDAGLGAELRLQRGDRAAAPGTGVAQIVQRRVVARRDIAAVRRLDRGGGDERAGEQVDQRAVAAQVRHDLSEQHGAAPQPVGESPCAVKTVAKLAEVARGAATGDEAAEGAADIG